MGERGYPIAASPAAARRGRRPSLLHLNTSFVRNNISNTEPLCLLQSLFDSGWCSATIRLDEPIAVYDADEMTMLQGDVASIATICAQMTFLIEKEALLDEENRDDNLPDLVKEHLDRLYEQLLQECDNYMPGSPLTEVLHMTGFAYLFPSVMDRLQLELRMCDEKVVTFQDYLSHITQLNQAFAMAAQLREDCGRDQHKYIAHQIALLYQCLSYQNLRTLDFKKRIEPEFEDIKRTTEQAAHPELTTRQVEWLRGLTTDIMDVCTDFNGPVTAFLHTWIDVLAHTPVQGPYSTGSDLGGLPQGGGSGPGPFRGNRK